MTNSASLFRFPRPHPVTSGSFLPAPCRPSQTPPRPIFPLENSPLPTRAWLTPGRVRPRRGTPERRVPPFWASPGSGVATDLWRCPNLARAGNAGLWLEGLTRQLPRAAGCTEQQETQLPVCFPCGRIEIPSGVGASGPWTDWSEPPARGETQRGPRSRGAGSTSAVACHVTLGKSLRLSEPLFSVTFFFLMLIYVF